MSLPIQHQVRAFSAVSLVLLAPRRMSQGANCAFATRGHLCYSSAVHDRVCICRGFAQIIATMFSPFYSMLALVCTIADYPGMANSALETPGGDER